MRDDIAKSGYTTDQIITLASIIQAEAANTDDMYMISAILRNRLENGAEHDIHTLDCDSTVYYPYKTANDAPEGFVSSYSTYDNSGLPAGPICNPGLEAIKAAIYPSEDVYKRQEDPLWDKLVTAIESSSLAVGCTEDILYKRVFLVVELIGSTCFATMIENKPDTIDNMKPVLYDMVRKMLA